MKGKHRMAAITHTVIIGPSESSICLSYYFYSSAMSEARPDIIQHSLPPLPISLPPSNLSIIIITLALCISGQYLLDDIWSMAPLLCALGFVPLLDGSNGD